MRLESLSPRPPVERTGSVNLEGDFGTARHGVESRRNHLTEATMTARAIFRNACTILLLCSVAGSPLGCAGNDDSHTLTGVFVLADVDGRALPAAFDDGLRVVAGAVAFRRSADGNHQYRVVLDLAKDSTSQPLRVRDVGSVVVQRDRSLRLVSDLGPISLAIGLSPAPTEGRITKEGVRLEIRGHRMSFRREPASAPTT